MDGLETTYEDSVIEDFIECAICNKSIRGDTQYKIHLTTIQHIRREDDLISKGQAIRSREIPDFKDIKEYFLFLSLDEPIIGLTELKEIPRTPNDPQPGPRYSCTLCDLEANMPNMVNHVVGRRHRQKYLEVKRKDLVTWNSHSILAQPGKTIRAKAEVVERQDGRGSPKPLRKNRNVGKSNITHVPQKPRGNQNWPLGVVKQGFPHHPTEGRDHHREGPPGNDPHFHRENAYGAERQVYLTGGHRRHDYMEEDLRREDYPEEDPRRQEFQEDCDYSEAYPGATYPEEAPRRRPYLENDPLKQFYSQEVQRRGAARSVEVPRDRPLREDESCGRGHGVDDPRGSAYPIDGPHPEADRGYYEEDPHGRGYHEGPASGRGAPQDDPYSEEARRGSYLEDETCRRAYPDQESHGLDYPEADPHRRSQDRDPSGYGYTDPADWESASAQGANRQRFADQPGKEADHLFELIKTYRQEGRGEGRGQRQEGRGQRQEEAERGPGGPGMRGPPPQRPPEGGRVRSDIPEPFRRFLAGAGPDKGAEKRKRKSRFSDATDEEIDMVKRMQVNEYRGQRTDHHTKAQDVHRGGNYPGDGSKTMSESSSEAGNVLDVLKNIEIENVEEANFLKEKLCHLLKEFEAKKLERAVHASQGPPVISKDYNHISNTQGESARDHYNKACKDEPEERPYENQPRRPEDRYPPGAPQGSYRGRSREEQEHMESYHNPHPEPRGAMRTCYEDAFGKGEQYPPPHAHPGEAAMYQERPEGSMYPHDYPPASEDRYDPFPPPGSSHRDYGYRMTPAPQRPTSLDKITSTLLELVARKSS